MTERSDDDVVIYHNPACGTSRTVLATIRATGIEPQVIEYLKNPPSAAAVRALAERMGVPLRALLREKGTPLVDLGLDRPGVDDATILAAVAAHPILLNRPIVVTKHGAKLCRPAEVVHDLLPNAAKS